MSSDRERSLVPYHSTRLLGERLLVLAPHPDDEVIACGGLIALHCAEGRQVTVVVASDGGASEGDPDKLPERRELECRRGLTALGCTTEPRFWRFADRQLSGERAALAARIAEVMTELAPDLVAVPSPLEVHPDHVALCRAFFDFAQRIDVARSPALTRVAFYEVSQPMQPNVLVDITAVATQKFAAIECHASQTAARDYVSYARGLNAYRAMTLPPETRFAEAYWVEQLSEMRLRPPQSLAAAISPKPPVELVREVVPISVVIRTRNRIPLLREAIESVKRNSHPAEIVVVNDGGESPSALRETLGGFELIDLESSGGRSAAMNRGVAHAKRAFLAFLDDDDLFYDEHLATLANAAATQPDAGFYTDAVSVFFERSADGAFAPASRHRFFSEEFDADLLVLDNYIPLPTLLVPKEGYLEAGGFDPAFDLFEDWDFLLRFTQKRRLAHIPRLTCEVRHFPTGDSLAMEASSELDKMRRGKERIWQKHGDRLTHAALTGAIERRKRRLEELSAKATDESGRARHLELDVERLEREKRTLLERLQTASDRASSFERDFLARAEHARRLEEILAETQTHAQQLERHRDLLAAEQTANGELLARLYGEVDRLNGLLASIYQSRTWKLHQAVERMKPRR